MIQTIKKPRILFSEKFRFLNFVFLKTCQKYLTFTNYAGHLQWMKLKTKFQIWNIFCPSGTHMKIQLKLFNARSAPSAPGRIILLQADVKKAFYTSEGFLSLTKSQVTHPTNACFLTSRRFNCCPQNKHS